MHSNQWKANMTLVIVAIGFILSSFVSQTFWGGLLFSGLTAALVGGMADWFAVTALFRQPLGITFRTAIIPRNRQRIFQDIVDMVEKTLLSKTVLKEKVLTYAVTERLIIYLEQGGKDHIQAILRQVVLDLICRIKPNDVGQIAESLVKRQLEKYSLAAFLAKIIRWSFKAGYDGKVLKFVSDEIIYLLEQPPIQQLVTKIIEQTKAAYVQNMDRRRFVIWMLDQTGMTSERMTELALQKAIEYLQAAQDENHPFRQRLNLWAEQFCYKLENDAQLQEKVEKIKEELLFNRLSLKRPISEWVIHIQADACNETGLVKVWLDYLNRQIEELAAEFRQNKVKQAQADQAIKNLLIQWIDQYHHYIGRLVAQNLNQYDDKALIHLIEHKVGDDLQMIRINGSVVGGLSGMALYLISGLL